MKKAKLLTLVFAIVTSIGMASAEIIERVQVGDLYYNLDTDNLTAEVTYFYYSGRSDDNNYPGLIAITIPAIVTFEDQTYNVTTIGDYAFHSSSDLVSVIIPNSVTRLEFGAFYGCEKLTSVEIPNSVTSVGRYAFHECTSLTSVTFGNGVTWIGEEAFAGCTNLSSLNFPNNITSVEERAFYECSSLTDLIYNEHVFAFMPTSYDGDFSIPNGIKEIAGGAFAGCTRLSNIEIPNSVTSIGDYAFGSCTRMTSIIIPKSVTSIGGKVFYNCTGLESVVIPNSVTSLGSYAFAWCTWLTSVSIPESITYISTCTFEGCKHLNRIINYSTTPQPVGNYAFAYVDQSSCVLYVPESSLDQYKAANVWKDFYAIQPIKRLIASGTCGDNITWELTCDSILTISGTGEMGDDAPWLSDYKEQINAVIIADGVTSIGRYAFQNCSGLTSIEIPNSVTSIGMWAFDGCSSLTSVEIPNSVTSIGNIAFRGCSSLTSVTIPNSVTSIGEGAFYNCSSLTSVEIPNSVTSIGFGAFEGCSSLTSVTIPNSVTRIEGSPFTGCNSLTSMSVEAGNAIYDSRDNCNAIIETASNTLIAGCKNTIIPNSVTSIGVDAFYNCSSLTSVTIPNSVTSIGVWAFSGCSGLTSMSVEAGNTIYDSRDNCNAIIETASNTLIAGCKNTIIPNSVTSIGGYAFFSCSSLTSVTIPNSVTSIGDWAFYGCGRLTSVEIPNSVTSIGNIAFCDCSSLTSITCEAMNPPALENNVFYQVDKSIPLYVPAEGIAAYQTATGWNEFTNIQAIRCVIASGTCGAQGDNLTWELSCDSVLTISGTGAMANYTSSTVPWYSNQLSIKSVVIENGVTSIGNYAFLACSSLTSITIPNSVTSIGNYAFSWCSGLISVTIPNSVTSIGESAFYGCSSLTSVTIPNSVTSIGDYAFQGCSGLTSVTIPNSVTSIGNGAFYGCYNLTSATIPNSVTSIGNSAFWNCRSLTSVTIPNSVTSIGNSAFWNCSSLTSIAIPNSVTSIGNGAFEGCSGLTSVTIGNSVTSIGNKAFRSCSSLTSITIPNSVTSIGYGAFAACSGLTSIIVESSNSMYDSRDNCNAIIETSTNTLIAGCQNTIIPNSVTSIGEWAFGYCSSLTSVTIPNSVTSIGNYAFLACSSLTSVTIPNSVTSIGDWAFRDCSSLTSITCEAESAPEFGSNAFYGVDKSIPLYVPSGSIAAYRAADQWKEFTNILPIDAESLDPNHPSNPGTYELTLNASIDGAGELTGAGMYVQGTAVNISAVANEGYTFEQWSDGVSDASRTITMLARDTTLTAVFSINGYTITFVDEDGTTVLASDAYTYGQMPIAPADPTKENSELYSYTFAGWTPDIAAVTAEATYTATYDATYLGAETVTVSDAKNASALPIGPRTNIIVTPTGHLTIDAPLTAKSLALQYGTAAHAQVTGIAHLNAESIEVALTINASRTWQAFAVPFDVSVASGISMDGSADAARYNYDFIIEEYDGNLRATTQEGWKRVAADATLQPGKLYMLYTAGATEWIMTAANPASLSEASEVTVSAYPSPVAVHHAGWNGIAGTLFRQAQPSLEGVQYITTYNNALSVYEVEPMSETVLAAAQPFFVQAQQAGTILFVRPSGAAARYHQAADEPLMSCVLSLSSDVYTDKAYLSAQADKENVYTIGRDLVKMQSASPSVPQLWLEAYSNHLAAYELPFSGSIAVVPLGLYAPASGEYTLNASTQADVYTLTLLYQGASVAGLGGQPVTVTLNRGDNTGYSVCIAQAPSVATGLVAPSALPGVTKFLRNGQLFILLPDGTTVSATGLKVE